MPTRPSSSTESEPPEGSPLGQILDGEGLATELLGRARHDADRLVRERGVTPTLAAILVGRDAASRIYVETKRRACHRVGITSELHELPNDSSADHLIHLIYRLNHDPKIHGILLQLPLPDRGVETAALAEIAPEKDVDGLSPLNQARLFAGETGMRPCTPLGIVELIDHSGVDLLGRRVVIVGTSLLIGRPLVHMLLERNATVTICHEFTADLASEVARAEVLVSAVGKAGLIRGAWVAPGAVVIDAGICRTPQGIRGDVEFEAARKRAGFITPVPGGVGPMTVAMLVCNTLKAARQQS